MTEDYVEFPLLDDEVSAPIPEPEVPSVPEPEPEPEPIGPKYEFDWYGKYLVEGKSRILVERSPEYQAQVDAESLPEESLPTQDDFMLDLEFRVTMLEMGM